MTERYDDRVSTRWNLDICCPKCRSRNVILESNKEGYYWIFKCNNCGYKGHENEAVGCVNKNDTLI